MRSMLKMPVLFDAERKRWVRIVDAVMVLLAAIGIGAALFYAPVTIEPAVLQYAFWGALVSLPFVAWMLYRETTINRVERIAILLLVLALGFAFIYIGFGQAARVA